MRKFNQFDEDYFKTGLGPTAYERKEPWLAFYASIVDQIVRSLQPKTVMDAGCALGMIVEALWDRGVVAKGVDISDFAIKNVRPDMREHCSIGSIAEPFNEQYDLIVCIEVLEHMPADDARLAITNFASSTDCVLFSSTPYDFEEITHVNVRPTLSWLEQFMEAGFVPDLRYDASYITPHAILFRKGEPLSHDVLSLMSEHLRVKHILKTELQNIAISKKDVDNEIQSYQEKLRARDEELVNLRDAFNYERSDFNKELSNLKQIIGNLKNNLSSMESSSSWRITTPMRSTAAKLPPKLRQRVRQIAKAAYWTITPHRIPARLQFIKARDAEINTNTSQEHDSPILVGAAKPALAAIGNGKPVLSSRELIKQNFHNLAPLQTFPDRSSERTITVLTDSVDRNSLFGGVGTALVAGILLAKKIGCRFRLATTITPPDPSVLGTILQAHKITFDGGADFVFIPLDQSKPLSMSDNDIILTTSWWTTYSALGSVKSDRIIYILQEDERMFYPHNDTRIKCSEILSRPDISILINTNLLYMHFKSGNEPIDNMSQRAAVFEPSFPAFPRPKKLIGTGKKNFFFYAHPNHARNLYWRGLEVIDIAMRQGILAKNEWEVNFFGHDLESIQLPNGVIPRIWSHMSWTQYAKLVAQMDLGLSLMDTPHPSYPPLDLAASGAVVVTNKHGIKTDLSHLSKNILTVQPDIDSLIQGLKEGSDRAMNLMDRYTNCLNDRISRDWELSLGPALDSLLSMRSKR